jgi:hypothetical protein
MKKHFWLLAIIILCSGNVFAETVWRGLLTVDRFPDDRCVITDFATLKIENWVDAASPEQVQAFLANIERQFEKDAATKGFNAVIGYSTTFVGGAGGVVQSTPTTQQHNVVVSGLINLRGVGVKLRCGK